MKKLAFLLAVMVILGCTKTEVKPIGGSAVRPGNAPAILQNDTVTYLALGDSYTYGSGVPLAESYPYQLVDSLAAKGYHAAPPQVIAFQGWTAADLLSGIQTANITRKFDIVTLLIGANDEAKGTDMTTYTMQLDQLLTQAIDFANGYASRVFVISIPDWSVTPFAAGMDKDMIRTGVTAFNMINQAETKKFGAVYVDLTALSETVTTDPSLTSADGLHPSGKMYGLWVRQFLPAVTGSFVAGH